MSDIKLVIKMPKESYEQIIEAGDLDYLEVITAIENGIPFQEIWDRGNSEYAENEELVDWIAIQLPKINKVLQQISENEVVEREQDKCPFYAS